MISMVNIITWTPTPGWGAQIGELSIGLTELPAGVQINRINVFRVADGTISFGPPLIPIGEHAGRHAGFEFPDAEDRRRFHDVLVAALKMAHPELFAAEG
jgi:hypothetical protein